MTWIRARSNDQKEQRVSEIIEATARLFEKHRFEEITFASIAEEAKFTRSNLYKYFNTKEEIFLEFLTHDLIQWREDIIKAYKEGRSYSVPEFASLWVTVFTKRKRLMQLLSMMYVQLEKNISEYHFAEFKRHSSEELSKVAEVICRIFPSLSQEQALNFFLLQLASCVGLYQMASYTDLQKKVLSRPEFKHMKMDFVISYTQAVEHLLAGMLG